MNKTEIDTVLGELRSRRMAKETAARAERADAFAKYRARADADQRELDRILQIVADVQRRIAVIEKSRAALSIQPPRRELTSWSPEGLSAALRNMSPAELAKLVQ